MKRIVKIAALLVGVLVALLVAAAVALAVFIDPNDYKPQISAAVERSTGREFVIEGDIDWSFFPWLGVETGTMVLGNAPGFGPAPFARAERASVSIRVLPLLRGELEVGTLVLHGLDLHLARNAAGATNWDDLVPEEAAEPEPVSPDARGLAGLAVGGIELREGRVTWTDDLLGAQYVAERITLTSGAVALNESFPIALTLEARASEPAMAGRLGLEGRVTLNPDAGRYLIDQLVVRVVASGEDLPGGQLEARLESDVAVDLPAQVLEVPRLLVQALGARVEARLTATGIIDSPAANGALAVHLSDATELFRALELTDLPLAPAALDGARLGARFEADLEAQRLTVDELQGNALGLTLAGRVTGQTIIDAPAFAGQLQAELQDPQRLFTALEMAEEPPVAPEALKGARLAAELEASLADQTLNVPRLSLQAADLQLSAQMRGEQFIDAPRFAGSLKVAQFAPRALLERLAVELPEMADPDVLASAAAELDFEASLEQAAVPRLRVVFDDSTLSGDASLRNFEAPVVRFALALDGIDADRYLPPDTEETAVPPTAAAAAGAIELPLELLRSLDVAGSVAVGSLKVMDLRLKDVQATVQGSEGLFRLQPFSAALYDGRYQGNMSLDVRGETPVMTMDDNLRRVQIGPLLQDFLGEEYLTGVADVSMALTAQGLTPEELTGSLNGRIEVSFRDGTVYGVNVAQVVRSAYARYTGAAEPKDDTRRTDFSELRASVTLADGKVVNRDLVANSPLLRVQGEGSLNLVTQEINYLLNTNIVGTLRGQDGRSLDELRNLPLPIRIRGTVMDPSFQLDLKPLLEARIQQELDERKREAEQRLKRELQEQTEQPIEQLEDKAKERLRELFRR